MYFSATDLLAGGSFTALNAAGAKPLLLPCVSRDASFDCGLLFPHTVSIPEQEVTTYDMVTGAQADDNTAVTVNVLLTEIQILR
jgi:hypothetical protein